MRLLLSGAFVGNLLLGNLCLISMETHVPALHAMHGSSMVSMDDLPASDDCDQNACVIAPLPDGLSMFHAIDEEGKGAPQPSPILLSFPADGERAEKQEHPPPPELRQMRTVVMRQ